MRKGRKWGRSKRRKRKRISTRRRRKKSFLNNIYIKHKFRTVLKRSRCHNYF